MSLTWGKEVARPETWGALGNKGWSYRAKKLPPGDPEEGMWRLEFFDERGDVWDDHDCVTLDEAKRRAERFEERVTDRRWPEARS